MSGQYAHLIARRDAILATARMSPEARARAMGVRYHPPMTVPAVIATKTEPPAPPPPPKRQTRIEAPPVLRKARSTSKMCLGIADHASIAVKARDIIHICCAVWGVEVDEVLTEARSRRMARPRQAAMHMMANHLRISQPSIAAFFKRDHTTVTTSVKHRVPRLMERDRAFCCRYRWAMRKLRRMWAAP